jgi:uncharacterized RDD family membrane protein YckC
MRQSKAAGSVATEAGPQAAERELPPVPAGSFDREAFEIASASRRVSAWLIDLVLLFVVVGVVAALLGGWQPRTSSMTNADGSTWTASSYYLNEVWTYGLLAIFSAIAAIPMWRIWTATPGQRLLGLRVLDAAEPRRISWFRAAIRWLVLYGWVFPGLATNLNGLFMFAVVGWMIGLLISEERDQRNRALHDRLARSLVVSPRVGFDSAWDSAE